MNKFKKRIIVILALLPSLVMAQEADKSILDYNSMSLEIMSEPDVSEKSNSANTNPEFYNTEIVINFPESLSSHEETRTVMHAEKVNFSMVDERGLPHAIRIENASVDGNNMSFFAKEAMILPIEGKIIYFAEEVNILDRKSRLDNLDLSKSLSITTHFHCKNGTVHEGNRDTRNSSLTRCVGGTEITIDCRFGMTRISTTTNSMNCPE